MIEFKYLLEKIGDAEFSDAPFPHIQVGAFFSTEHFAEIIAASEIALPVCGDDRSLLSALLDNGYRILDFPGCFNKPEDYIAWHRTGHDAASRDVIEGEFGLVLRLVKPLTPTISRLKAFLESELFVASLAAKFSIAPKDCVYDCGIQKYLDGYQISPHPDIRRKALTYMININPFPASEQLSHHTQYLRFKSEFAYISAYWSGNPAVERAHLPWFVAEPVWTHTHNNSAVIFAPSNESLHAVRASYDHLSGQRTQLYGNLWYRKPTVLPTANWSQLAISARLPPEHGLAGFRHKVSGLLPPAVKSLLRSKRSSSETGLHYRKTVDRA